MRSLLLLPLLRLPLLLPSASCYQDRIQRRFGIFSRAFSLLPSASCYQDRAQRKFGIFARAFSFTRLMGILEHDFCSKWSLQFSPTQSEG